ncbi:MAG: prepilin peptidase [Firmicutes bacterium]|nr:prepilin peptidase [Bacillota bacterium]
MTSSTWILAETALLVALAVHTSYTDLRWRRVSNFATMGAVAAAMGLAAFRGLPDLGWHILGAGVGFLAFYPAYHAGWVGGGDVKLLCAHGAILGFPGIGQGLFYGALFGGMGALVWIARHRPLRQVPRFACLCVRSIWPRLGGPATGPSEPGALVPPMPYALYLNLGALVAWGGAVLW